MVEVLKFIIQRKIFVLLYESYINKAIYQQYNIAFAYFVAICKQYPFRKLEEFCNYKTYKIAFRHLFKPFMRSAFRKFIKICYTKSKVEYLVLFLSKLFKNKIFSKIYNYRQNKNINKNQKNEDNKEKIEPFVNILIKPLLKKNFEEFKNKINLKNEEIKINNNDNDNININKKNDEDKFKKIENKDINKFNLDLDRKDDSVNISDSENKHRRKNDNSVKMNSYLYESFGSDSKSFSLEPNSEDNDKLHQLKMMLLIKHNYGDLDNSRDSNSMSLNNSSHNIPSKKLLEERINGKLNISDDEINMKQNKKIDTNKEKNNSIEMDVSADNDKMNEIEWGYNINTINSKEDKDKDKENKN